MESQKPISSERLTAISMSSPQKNVIEMHCHTVFSPDAMRTPEEIVEAAAGQGVSVLSITDHNHLGAQERAAQRAADLNLRYVTGVEIDAIVPDGQNCHFVCFDIDVHDPALRALIKQTASSYAQSFLEVHPYLQEYGYELDLEEMAQRLPERYPTNPEAEVNIYFARTLLLEKNANVADFLQIAGKIQQRLREDNPRKVLPRVQFDAMRDAVHSAGGKVLLAHVSRYHRGEMDRQLSLIEQLLELGMDGFELYHPDNVKEADFYRLENMAQSTDCFLSGGSDCHDALKEKSNRNFAKTKVDDWFLQRLV